MTVRIIPLPTKVHGFVTRCVEPDGEYDTIVLNACDSYSVQQDTLTHELRHITYGHFDDDRPLWEKEREAENG